jgi:hypothetical protein
LIPNRISKTIAPNFSHRILILLWSPLGSGVILYAPCPTT